MTDHTCDVPECTKPIKRKQLCYGHYMKQWRYGTTHPQHDRWHHDLEGQTFGELTAVQWAEGKWECQCACGGKHYVPSAELLRGSTTSCGDRRIHRRIETVGYSAAHDRVRSDRGLASDHSCTDCGRAASHWSYDHTDPDELISSAGLPYSVDPKHYSPRCVPCHKVFDLGRESAGSASL